MILNISLKLLVQNKVKILSLLLFLSVGCEKESLLGPCTSCKCVINYPKIYTWEEIYSDSITTLVDKNIIVKSKVYWSNEAGWIPEIGPPEIKPADGIRLLFENANDYVNNPTFYFQDRGNLKLISKQIKKYIDFEVKEEKYSLNGKEISKNGDYYLFQGKIRYRSWLNVDEEKLANPNFITQSNNVTYWNQTFEFEAEMICCIE